MANDGDYPLLVYVGNRFKTGINLSVTFTHWPLGEQQSEITLMNKNSYDIMPGDCLIFPLYWGDESLTIKIPKNAVTPYYILLGPKVKCTSDNLKDNGTTITFIPSGMADYLAQKSSQTYSSKSGVWTINDNSLEFTIEITKYSFDPETTNVSVGEDLP
ncbi:MAG: hypothetical protein PVH61_08330 [Candidatus Aminicenantes bacterium]|jgi:hypothetical protein